MGRHCRDCLVTLHFCDPQTPQLDLRGRDTDKRRERERNWRRDERGGRGDRHRAGGEGGKTGGRRAIRERGDGRKVGKSRRHGHF